MRVEGAERTTRPEAQPAPLRGAVPADAMLRRLARAVGNRGMARLLQRWVDQDGKSYPGAEPDDAENWETYDHSGEQRWRPKTAPVAAAAPVATVVKPAEVKPAAAAKAAEPVKSTVAAAADDSTTVWWMSPATIRYSQDSISPTFKNTTKITDAARALLASPTKVDAYPALLLIKREGGKKIISLDNRRLWVFKHAGVPLCKVRWASAGEYEAQRQKMTAGKTGSAFIGVTGLKPDMSKLPVFTPQPGYTRKPNTHYV
jgi:hypothetical protein